MSQRKRDHKLTSKEETLDLNQLQRQQLEQEAERYDHNEIDEQNQEFAQAAKQKRKLHRKHEKVKGLEGESDVDEEFRVEVGEAAGKFAVKRKKKHLFNDAGIPIEPFNIANDIREGTLTREGVFKMEREKKSKGEEESEEDAWYESIKEEQAKMLLKKSQRQQDSDASESEDDLGDASQDKESENEEKLDKRDVEKEIIGLKRELVKLMESNENANLALQRLKATQPKGNGVGMNTFAPKKKNVRIKLDIMPQQEIVKVVEETKQPALSDKDAFDKLLQITLRLQQLGYTEVFTERRSDIDYELKQLDLQQERELLKKARFDLGWYYKINYKASGTESEVYGPFTQDEMNDWKRGNYFKETDEQFCSFIKAPEHQQKKDQWQFIDDISDFKY